MKTQIKQACIVLLLFASTILKAQHPYPLQQMEGRTIDSSEVVFTYTQNDTLYQKVFKTEKSGRYTDLVEVYSHVVATGLKGQNKKINCVSIDLDNDSRDEIVTAYVSAANKITLKVLKTNGTSLALTPVSSIDINANVYLTPYNEDKNKGNLNLITGNFDADIEKEIVLSFVDSVSRKPTIILLDGNGSMTLTKVYELADEVIHPYYETISIVKSDLDGNGRDELALGLYTGTGIEWKAHLKIYEVIAGQLVLRNKKQIASGYAARTLLTLAADDFNNDVKEEIAFIISLFEFSHNPDTRIYLVKYSEQPNSSENNPFEVAEIAPFNSQKNEVNLHRDVFTSRLTWPDPSFCARTYDMLGNGQKRLLVAGTTSIMIFDIDRDLKITHHYKLTTAYISRRGLYYGENTSSSLDILDIDQDGLDEVITARNTQINGMDIVLSRGTGGSDPLCKFENFLGNFSSDVRWNIIGANLNGDRIQVGKGVFTIVPHVVQPLVIVNVPPIHYDSLAGTIYDINKCYNGFSNCNFSSTYFTNNSVNVNLSTDLSGDWGVSSSLSGGFGALGFNFKANLDMKYGEKFSKSNSTGKHIQVSTQMHATTDDIIFATETDYEIVEYPVYQNGELKGHILSMVPAPASTFYSHMDSKSWGAYNYIPQHEVGNILSYKNYASLNNNPNASKMLKGNYGSGGSFTLSQNSGSFYDWNFLYSDISSQSSSLSQNIGIEVGTSVSGWGVNASVKGHYDKSEISTHKSTIENTMKMNVHLGQLNPLVPEPGYKVTPYVYWANNGAVVLDYAVEPSLPLSGGTNTFWSAKYGTKQDLSWIMPWRLDPTKGISLGEEDKRYQTKSITFSPGQPSPGDTVTLIAYIHNFSLQSSDPVEVSFYMGNPAVNGTIIASVTGQTVFTSPMIAGRDRSMIQFKWVYTGGSRGIGSRIYGVIDPKNKLDEIRKENNTAWTLIGVQPRIGTAVEEKENQKIKSTEKLSKIYPNPMAEHANIQLELPAQAMVSIELFDLTGQIVKTILKPRHMLSGKYVFPILSEEISNGLYLCRITIDNRTEQHRLLINK